MSKHQSQSPPNRHVLALLTFIALLPLVYFIPPWIIENITEDRLIVTLIAVGVIVPIISYVFLPACFWTIGKIRTQK